MSVRATSAVWESSRSEGSDRLLLLAIANLVNGSSDEAWPSVETLTRMTRLSDRSIHRSIHKLIDLGELAVDIGGGRNKTNRYRLLIPRQPVGDSSPVNPDNLSGNPGNLSLFSAPETPTSTTETPTTCPETPTSTTLNPDRMPPRTKENLKEEQEQEPKSVARASARGTRLPEDWKPSEKLVKEMRDEGIADTLARRELAKFSDHWASTPGQRGVKLNWDATWRNWLRRANENSPPPADTSSNGWQPKPFQRIAGVNA